MLILKALVNEPDSFIYSQLIKNKENDSFYKGYAIIIFFLFLLLAFLHIALCLIFNGFKFFRCISNMLRQINCSEGISSQNKALNYLGEKFSVKFDVPSWYSNIDAAKVLIA